MRVDDFDVLFYANGKPKAFPDRLTVTHDGEHPRPTSATIDVNTPMTVDGVSFSQSTYGAAAYLIVLDKDGKPQPGILMGANGPTGEQTRRHGCNSICWPGASTRRPSSRYPSSMWACRCSLPIRSLTRVGPRRNYWCNSSAWMPKRGLCPLASPELTIRRATIPGVSQRQVATWRWNGLQFVFLVNRVTGLSATSNPAINYIYAAFVTILLGLFGVLYFPYTRIWAKLGPVSPLMGREVRSSWCADAVTRAVSALPEPLPPWPATCVLA